MVDERPESPRPEGQGSSPTPDGVSGKGGRRVSAYVTRDLTKGSVPKTIWFLAWPQMVEGGLLMVNQIVDIIWAGRLGFRIIAGVGVAQTYVQLAQMARMGFDTSMAAMVARAVGAGNTALANHIALQAFTLSGFYSLLMILVGLFLTEPLLRVVGVGGDALAEGARYMQILFIGMASIAFTRMSGAALEASGDVMTPMRAMVVARVLHIAFSPFLVFGWWWFPSMGITGAALANVISQSIGAAINFYALFIGTSRLHLTLRGYYPDLPLLWRLVKLGVPASITGIERATAMLVVVAIVARFGDAALAAYTVSRRVEGVVHLASNGLGRASGTLVGQNLGARQPNRARQTVLWSTGYVTLILTAVAGSVFAFPTIYASIFTREPEVLDVIGTWLRIGALAMVALGMGQVLNESFNRAGDTLAVMIVNLVRLWGVEVPLAFLLSLVAGLNEYGVVWALVIAVWFRIVVYIPYFFWGRWLRIKVI